jgi:hypothetical protein
MELTDDQLDLIGCRQDGATCPCLPCAARRDMKEAKRLMQVAVSGYKSGSMMSSDKTGYINALMEMESFLRTPHNTGTDHG